MAQNPLRLPILQTSQLVALEPLALPPSPVLPAGVTPLALSAGDLDGRAELRTSSYTIYVDLPDDADNMLLVHAYTGAYDRVGKRVATYLRSRERHHAPKPLYGDWTPEPRVSGEVVPPSDETIAVLKRRGYLVSLTQEEEEALFVKLSAHIHHATVRRSPRYVLMPTYQCNLRCSYCFQDHMRTDAKYGHLLRVMDRDMADRVMRGMQRIEAAHGIADGGAAGRSVMFFGGEPLLAETRPVVEHIINTLRAWGRVSFSAISNATELEAYRDLLGEGLISQIQITLDGPPAEHDARRIYADGSGSYDRIAANVDMALDLGVLVSVRMNVDRDNIDRLPALMDDFHARGWLDRPGFGSYVAAISLPHGDPAHRTTFTSWQLARAMSELGERHPRLSLIGLPDDAVGRRARQIFDGQGDSGGSFRTAFCGAHTTMYVIDPFADIYACWERTGEVLMNRGLVEQWRGRNIVSNPVCRRCRYAVSCGGGCAPHAEEVSGTSYSNFCDGYAKRFRASVAQSYLSYARGEHAKGGASLPCEA
jgi:uncharacterized protein